MAHDDPELETRVLEAFNNDPILSERAIEVGTSASGVIVLSGWVYTDGEVEYATTIARGVPGVARVRNSVRVRIDDRRAAAETRNGEAPVAE